MRPQNPLLGGVLAGTLPWPDHSWQGILAQRIYGRKPELATGGSGSSLQEQPVVVMSAATYTFVEADRGKLYVFTTNNAIATLPLFADGWYVDVVYLGTGASVLTVGAAA